MTEPTAKVFSLNTRKSVDPSIYDSSHTEVGEDSPEFAVDKLVAQRHLDVKEIDDLRSSLHQKERELQDKDEFLAIAAHELSTPITTMKLRLETGIRFIEKNKFSGQDAAKLKSMYLGTVKQIDRMAQLIDNLLDLSRIKTGRLVLNREPLNPGPFISEIVARYSDQLSYAKCSMRLDLEPGIIGFWDPIRLEQVVTNLISNAIRYAPGHPVQVGVQKIHESALIFVKDGGPGISEENKQKIFERYSRATSAWNGRGLGLGLFVSREIVEAHGGEIEVDSTPGRGATFKVTLPLNQ